MIEILAPGLLATVQDTGRNGARALGIGGAGAMDCFAARVANALLGNADAAPVLELTMGGVEIGITEAGCLALSGADLAATLDGQDLPLCAVFAVVPGQLLRLAQARCGIRACLGVRGGFATEQAFGSGATDLRGGFGGHQGRALRRGDRIRRAIDAAQASRTPARGSFTTLANPYHRHAAPLGLIEGPALAQLAPGDRARMLAEPFTLSRVADRMGLRLEESLPSAAALPQQLSSAVVFGAVQLPPDGKPIILGADCQTSGGYPLAGVVAGVDHWRIAQARPGDALAFRLVGLREAQRAWRVREQELARLRIAAGAAWQGN